MEFARLEWVQRWENLDKMGKKYNGMLNLTRCFSFCYWFTCVLNINAWNNIIIAISSNILLQGKKEFKNGKWIWYKIRTAAYLERIYLHQQLILFTGLKERLPLSKFGKNDDADGAARRRIRDIGNGNRMKLCVSEKKKGYWCVRRTDLREFYVTVAT